MRKTQITQIKKNRLHRLKNLGGICVIFFEICVIINLFSGYLFATTQIPVTATATVAPEGQYAPVITVTDQTLREGEILEFEVLAADANPGDIVHLEITQGQPPWLTIISNTDNTPPGGTARMVLSAAPPSGAIGNYRVYFKATDNSPYNMSSTKDIYITVNPANQAPAITAQNQNVLVGNTLTFTVSCEDPDGADTVTFTYSGNPSWLNGSATSPATGNPISIIFTGTPSATGQYTMDFTATDNGAPQQSASKQITVTVNQANHPPVLNPIRNKQVPVRVKLEFTISATDQDSDTLTYSATGLPFSNGATLNSSTGKFTWTPTNDQAGDYTAHFEVSDGTDTDSEDITIYVVANDAPVFNPLSDKYVKVEKPLSFVVTAKDPNNDALTYSASNLPPGAVFNSSTHTFTWTPTLADGPVLPEQVRPYRDVTFTVTDGTYTATKGIWIFVRPTDAPDLEPIGDKYVKANETLSFTINASDPNGLSLSYSASNLPSGALFNPSNQTFTWMPNETQIGEHRDVMFTVTDSAGLSDTKGIWIFVQPSNAPTIEHIGDKTIVEGRTLSFRVNATGSGSLAYSAANLPVGAEFNSSTCTFTWIPAIGQAGVYRDVRFSVTDGVSTVNEDIWIFVDANSAPIIDPLTDKYVKVDEFLSFGISAYDPNGDDLEYRALNLPSGATFTNRTFNWTPTRLQMGTYRDVMFEISDGTNIVTKGIWIFVSASGAPVLGYPGDKYVTIGDTLTFTVNATDPNVGDTLTYSASNLPTGAFFNPSTRTFTWTPNSNQVGTYRDVMFHVTDDTYTDTKGIWIFVKAQGAPTINVPGDKYVRAGNPNPLEFSVSATDLDTPQSGLTYSAANLPPGATFANQVFNWTPSSDQVGTYPDVIFTVSDVTYTDSKGLWIFVTSANAPEFSQDVADKYGRVGEAITFSVLATDPDNSPSQLTYSAINLPLGATFTNQTFNWTPQQDQAGTYRDVRLEVKDPNNNIDSDTFWIFIEENSPPKLDDIGTKYGNVGQLLTFPISANDPDVGDHLTFTASNLPAGATLTDNGNRTATFNWANPVAGTYSNVHFEVTDGINPKVTDDITIKIS